MVTRVNDSVDPLEEIAPGRPIDSARYDNLSYVYRWANSGRYPGSRARSSRNRGHSIMLIGAFPFYRAVLVLSRDDLP